MRFAVAAVAAGLAGAAVAQNATASDVYVTDVVTAFTTYCPEATQLTHGGQTYTVSEATTLTITNCPGGCTITKPVYSSSSPAVAMSESSSAAVTPTGYSSVAVTTSVPVAPAPYSSSMAVAPSAGAPYPSSNGTAPAPYSSGAAAGTGSGSSASSTSTAAPYTGAAGKAYAATGAGVLALFGLVAAL